MLATFTDLLPPTRSEPKGSAFDWTPAAADGPKAGVLTIKQRRLYTTYAVVEFPADFGGRAFMLAKVTEGSDPTEERYACLIPAGGREKRCECKGFNYAGHCKHLSALAALINAGQL